MYTLALRDNALYAKETVIDEQASCEIVNWYLLATSLAQFRSWFASEALMQEKIGCTLHPTVHPATAWRDEQGWTCRLASGNGPRAAAFTSVTPLPRKGSTKK